MRRISRWSGAGTFSFLTQASVVPKEEVMRAASGLDRFMRDLDSPMYVVTATHRDKDLTAGCLISYATRCSLSPERFLACLSVPNYTHRIAADANFLAVHSLEVGHREIARLFGGPDHQPPLTFSSVSHWNPGHPA